MHMPSQKPTERVGKQRIRPLTNKLLDLIEEPVRELGKPARVLKRRRAAEPWQVQDPLEPPGLREHVI